MAVQANCKLKAGTSTEPTGTELEPAAAAQLQAVTAAGSLRQSQAAD